MDIDSFVPLNIQSQLESLGWVLTFSTFSTSTSKLILSADGRFGMQTWKLITGYDSVYMLDIHYNDGIKDFKEVTLWLTSETTESFKLRNIISVLKRRKLYRVT